MEEDVDSKIELEHQEDYKSKQDTIYQEANRWRVENSYPVRVP
jgi:hypothetical protein